jgi:hypothetical protein
LPIQDFANGHAEFAAYLNDKYDSYQGYRELQIYLLNRYDHVQDRFSQSLRYVDLDPENYKVYSYEYTSLIRDIGGIFTSFLDKLIRITSKKNIKGDLDIRNYRDYLIEHVHNVEEICVELNASYKEKYLFPFKNIKNRSQKIVWWDAYNCLKHNDVEERRRGCLSNTLYSLASLNILVNLFDPNYHFKSQLFEIGVYSDLIIPYDEIIKQYSFPIYNSKQTCINQNSGESIIIC